MCRAKGEEAQGFSSSDLSCTGYGDSILEHLSYWTLPCGVHYFSVSPDSTCGKPPGVDAHPYDIKWEGASFTTQILTTSIKFERPSVADAGILGISTALGTAAK